MSVNRVNWGYLLGEWADSLRIAPPAYDLTALRQAAGLACVAAAAGCNACRHEAINWADLHCDGAERCVDDAGEVIYRVWISEVDPCCGNLRQFITDYLAAHGFAGVAVHLEW